MINGAIPAAASGPASEISSSAATHLHTAPGEDSMNTRSHDPTSSSVAATAAPLPTAQTRFSFYNAADFLQRSPQTPSPAVPSSPAVAAGPVTRFNSYQASPEHPFLHQSTLMTTSMASLSLSPRNVARKTLPLTTAVTEEAGSAKSPREQAQESSFTSTAQQQQAQGMDSVEILKSLQEHEQQRFDILSGPTNRETTSNTGSSSSSSRGAQEKGSVNHSFSSQQSNPYEDAIREALHLLRRHRDQNILQSNTPSRPSHLDTSLMSDYAGEGGTVAAVDPTVPRTSKVSARTPPENDRLLRMRHGGWDGALTPGGASDAESSTSAAMANAAFLGEAYQAEIEARRKQRQERMARYASRLAELKQEAATKPTDNTSQTHIPGDHDDHESLLESSAADETWHDSLAFDDRLEQSYRGDHNDHENLGDKEESLLAERASAYGDEVHRGVERVLLAILERANSRGRSIQTTSSWQQDEEKKSNLEDRDQTATDSGMAGPASSQNDNHMEEDALLRAMSDLLGSTSESMGPLSANSADKTGLGDDATTWTTRIQVEERDRGLGKRPTPMDTICSVFSDPTTGTDSALMTNGYGTDRLPAVRSDPGPEAFDELDRMVQLAIDEKQRQVVVDEIVRHVVLDSATQEESARPLEKRVRMLLEESSEDFDDEMPGDDDSDDEEEDDTIDDTLEDGLDDESEEDMEDGVSYEEDLDDEEDDSDVDLPADSQTLDGVLGPLSEKSGGATGVVLEKEEVDPLTKTSPSILDSLSAAIHLVTKAASPEKPLIDKYSTDLDDLEDPTIHDSDEEAVDLMRSLCAHLLPIGVDQYSRILDSQPEWDESNHDEPGYRIVRLNSYQLRGIEIAFEDMINGLKQNSERHLSLTNGSDDAFERDLQAAEDLLDREEKRLKDAETAIHHVAPSTASKVTPKPIEQHDENALNTSDTTTAALPCFPGVKSAGQGEMGDLEFFHLPVIFKSHVTGFEPTKDLFLEAGNVVAGQYLVEGEIGSAAFSTAYRCLDLSTDGDGADGHEEVCLKVIKNTKDFFDQSLDEIKILELLRQTGKCHENHILEMKTFFYHREHLIIVTELLRQNLFEFGKFIVENAEEPYFTLPRLSFITRQCLIALDFVHQLGLVHSDVKPENILLSSYSRAQVKLIDFGSSCYLTDRQSSYIQSRSYRAPEVVLGLPYDGKIDVWSLGCVVAEMFTGEVTFQNDSIVSMLSRIEAICGPFPRHMIAQGRQAGRFFTKCGLLFEKVSTKEEQKEDSYHEENSKSDDSDVASSGQVDIFQPKRTTLAARLGFAADLMTRRDNNELASKEEKRHAIFVDFVRSLLRVDPESRPSAAEALQHPWMKYAEALTEEDIKYPSS